MAPGRAPPETPRAVPLSPSSAFDEEIGRAAAPGATAIDRQHALDRGRIVHRLMQSLPDIPSPRRMDAAARYLAGAAKDFSSAEQAEIVRQISAILDAPEFAELFAPGSRAEVPIVGRFARMDGAAERVAGQVDRLVVTDTAVLIGDYKTDGLVPRGLDEVPPAYVAQLALYRAVLIAALSGQNCSGGIDLHRRACADRDSGRDSGRETSRNPNEPAVIVNVTPR